MSSSYANIVLFHAIMLISGFNSYSQTNSGILPDTIINTTNNAPILADSLKTDTLPAPPTNSNALDAEVEYGAKDSISFDLENQKAYLYGEAYVNYQSIKLTAAYIIIDFKTKLLSATGVEDSIGQLQGTPIFEDGGKSFTAEELKYNFDTKKGKITKAITQEGDGFIHGTQIKMASEDVMYIKNGKYTTCSNEEPHFHIQASKLKYIKDDKIVTGPAFLKIENVPTPLALPFGFFPNQEKQTSGIIIPTYGESPGLGFFLNNGGYYFAINDFVDLTLGADIYSRGSWGLSARSNYKVRYRYNGYLDLSFSKFIQGERYINQSKSQNYFIKWKHSQDPKARPNSRFSADVNFGSTKNFQNNYNVTAQDYLTNTFKSNITYNTKIPNKPINFTINGSHSQNSRDSSITITLPEATVSLSRIYPLKSRVKVGKDRWYEKIGLAYTGSFKNRITTSEKIFNQYPDSLTSLMKNGILHSIPISTSFKLLKYFSISPTFRYTERWYLKSAEKNWAFKEYRDANGELVKDTVASEITTYNNGFNRAGEYNFSTGVSTTIYGTYQYKLKHLKAIRHVMYPAATLSMKPDYSSDKYGYYQTYAQQLTDSTSREVTYSRFDGLIYGGPSGKTQSGFLNLSLRNTLDAKVLSRRDSTNTEKKVKLLDNLNFSSSYSLFADSLNWNPVRIYIKSRFAKNIDVQVNTTLDPYAFTMVNNAPVKINTSTWKDNGSIARLTNFDLVLSWRLKSKKPTTIANSNKKEDTEKKAETPPDLQSLVDFNAPWSLNMSYRYNYARPFDKVKETNTFNFNGDVRITEKWKIGFRSGYDIALKKFTYSSFDIYRDLHCWELSFNVVPFGQRRSYSVDLRVKASTLSDLKLSRRRNWYDYQ